MNVSKYFVVNVLLSQPEVAELVGDRVYPRVVDSSVSLPFLVVRKAGETRDSSLDGASKIESSKIEIYCVASTDEKMEELKLAIIELLHGVAIAEGGIEASFRLTNDADVDDDLEETSFTGVLEFELLWNY